MGALKFSLRDVLWYNFIVDRNTLKERARKLRKKGKTYSEIQETLGVNIPKGTLSSWFSDIKFTEEQVKRIECIKIKNLKAAREKAVSVNKKKQEIRKEGFLKKNKNLEKNFKNNEVLKLLLAMLYLGEGSKWKSHRGMQLANSNPEVINTYLRLLEECYKINRNELKASIYFRADQDIKSLISFWSRATSIPSKNFYVSKPDLRTMGKKTKKGYYGVCSICGPGTEIQLEIEAITSLFSEI